MAQLNNTQFESYSDFYQQWQWQWFTTLTFEPGINSASINSLRLNWSRSLGTIEKMQVAYFYTEVYASGHPHLHLLMIGSNHNNKTLLDIDHHKWESAWPYRAHIFIPDSNIAVSKYLTKNIAQFNSEYDSYNLKLLKKTMNCH